ncbi:hypothetical protein SESBI_04139 [Sesbania bispinosa]|nr:hypothetical protein SESBI_04139 [Sesbania bispinosa]
MAPKRKKLEVLPLLGLLEGREKTPSQATQELLEIPEDRFLSKEHEERFNKNIICRDIIRREESLMNIQKFRKRLRGEVGSSWLLLHLKDAKFSPKSFMPTHSFQRERPPLNIFLMSGAKWPKRQHWQLSCINQFEVGPRNVLRELCLPGAQWIFKKGTNKPRAIWRTSLKPIPRVWATFVMSKLLPVSNNLKFQVERALLIYCIMMGKHIDVGRLIAHNIYKLANSPKFKLGYPHLITQIIADQSIPRVPIERIRPEKSIDAKYIQAVFDEIPEEFCTTD